MIIQVVRMRRWTWANMQFINQNDTRIYSPSVGNPLGGLFYPGKRGDKALRLEGEELLCWEFSALKKKKKSEVLVLQWIFLRNVMSVFSLCSTYVAELLYWYVIYMQPIQIITILEYNSTLGYCFKSANDFQDVSD